MPKVDFKKELPPPPRRKDPLPFTAPQKNPWLEDTVRLRKPRGGFSGE